ncbi:ankyrin repeat-containing domain protein [Leptodontidium sp. MPI-SDFR-AT-0119]|nr:ankyrin repeat-containing domain protein [Leptodontidium sp. MPI-SDFR-AT-0119]
MERDHSILEDSCDRGGMEAKERKRVQNRIAQRNYRRNQKERLRALEKAVNHLAKVPPVTLASNKSVPVGMVPSPCDQIWNDAGEQRGSDLNCVQNNVVDDNLGLDWEEGSLEPETVFKPVRPALHRAVLAGNEPVCRMLLDKGAYVGKQDTNGQTPLHLAVDTGREEILKLFLDGGNQNARDCMGRTALFNAIASENKRVLRLLLDAEIDIDCKDALGETALHVAVETGVDWIIRLLLEYGADVDA